MNIELQDLPDGIQAEILQCAVDSGLPLVTIMGWINAGVVAYIGREKEA